MAEITKEVKETRFGAVTTYKDAKGWGLQTEEITTSKGRKIWKLQVVDRPQDFEVLDVRTFGHQIKEPIFRAIRNRMVVEQYIEDAMRLIFPNNFVQQ